jgi:phage terminase large subunit-like protein
MLLICAAGRGFGKSFVASLLITINFLQGKRIIALAQNYKALNEVLFQEIRNRLDELEINAHVDKNAMKITYGNGVIYGASYEGIESIRGLSNISLAVCDEAALSPPKLFETLTPCLRGNGITGKVRLLSTPRRGSWLNLYCKEHSDSVEVITAKTSDNKMITEEQLRLMKSTIINPEIARQELEGVMLDIDSDASVIQLCDYPSRDNGI